MADDLSLTQPVQTVQTVTVEKPDNGRFTALLYVAVVIIFLLFTMFMSHVHNDPLASKGMDFAYIVLGALTQASTGGAKKQ